MYKKKTMGAVAVLCTVMLVFTAGFASASKTTTQLYQQQLTQQQQEVKNFLKEIKTYKHNALNMTNNTKEQILRVLSITAVTLVGLYLIWKLRGFKKASTFITGVVVGFDVAVGTALILHIQRTPQNNTNSTI